MTRAYLVAAGLAAAALLLVMGAALRPLITDGHSPAPPVLTAEETAFVQDMYAHHSQALVMVDRLSEDASPEVRALAGQIAEVQRAESGMMLGWLRLAGESTVNPDPMAWMHVAPAGHGHTPAPEPMPGMATRADLDALAAARGPEAEAIFLRLMYFHHQGGMTMARAAMSVLPDGAVSRTAREMLRHQGQEASVIGLLMGQREVR
ncbi:DUF305 domain-containing protein [Nocardia puris]|uniref:Uncharacterized protein (DUF305 family) n=1 Tax=Nocardia puris TaxID=208602 RepID=A0A366E153_9NOCA|nr:DUF305 domain-containing protein [Nocardia puris]RBO96062.1 uncharacterized protein (DUF305 family) [Nocardia puris]